MNGKNRPAAADLWSTPPPAGRLQPPSPSSPATPAELALRFTGSATEYFRIWIVNLCLTLFTLGIFSAWAKVREKRYFYSHRLLDGAPYHLEKHWPSWPTKSDMSSGGM